MLEEFFDIHTGVPKRALQCIAVNFIVIRENDLSSVGMRHLNVTTTPMKLNEAEPL